MRQREQEEARMVNRADFVEQRLLEGDMLRLDLAEEVGNMVEQKLMESQAEDDRATQEHRRKAEAHLKEMLQKMRDEKEAKRMVPIRIRFQGLNYSKVADKKGALEEAFLKNVSATLGLESDQIRVLDIADGREPKLPAQGQAAGSGRAPAVAPPPKKAEPPKKKGWFK